MRGEPNDAEHTFHTFNAADSHIPAADHIHPRRILRVNLFANQTDLSEAFAINLAGCLLIFYDWNLFGTHYNRSKYNIKTFFVYFLIGAALIGLWLQAGIHFLQSGPVLPDASSLIRFGYGRPMMMIAYSFLQAAVISIGFKVLTDHMDVRRRELQAILISGFLFGLFYTLIFSFPFELTAFVRSLLYNVILTAILSYLYNQSHSFMPGFCAFTVIYFSAMIAETF